jgi:hypothetical protein
LASIRNGRLPSNCPKGFVQPLDKTLVMGGLNAVLAAQEAHLGLLDEAGVTSVGGDIGRSGGFPRGLSVVVWRGETSRSRKCCSGFTLMTGALWL